MYSYLYFGVGVVVGGGVAALIQHHRYKKILERELNDLKEYYDLSPNFTKKDDVEEVEEEVVIIPPTESVMKDYKTRTTDYSSRFKEDVEYDETEASSILLDEDGNIVDETIEIDRTIEILEYHEWYKHDKYPLVELIYYPTEDVMVIEDTDGVFPGKNEIFGSIKKTLNDEEFVGDSIYIVHHGQEVNYDIFVSDKTQAEAKVEYEAIRKEMVEKFKNKPVV